MDPTRSAIVDFVGRVTAEGAPDFVAPEARIAVFDNDGTLWCEKPALHPARLIVRRLAEKASVGHLVGGGRATVQGGRWVGICNGSAVRSPSTIRAMIRT